MQDGATVREQDGWLHKSKRRCTPKRYALNSDNRRTRRLRSSTFEGPSASETRSLLQGLDLSHSSQWGWASRSPSRYTMTVPMAALATAPMMTRTAMTVRSTIPQGGDTAAGRSPGTTAARRTWRRTGAQSATWCAPVIGTPLNLFQLDAEKLGPAVLKIPIC